MKGFASLFLFCLLFQTLPAQVNFTDSNLPILVVTVSEGQAIVDEPKVDAHLGIVNKDEGQRNRMSDPFNEYDGKIGIELRGASSQGFDKKSYSFETRKEDGSNKNVSLLDMPKENDWVLHGPFSDKSLMRNAIIYTLAGWTMEYAPRPRFCELVLDGDYKGVYLLTEKIKRDKNRVDIAKLSPDENEGDDLTGGYILKLDKTEGSNNDGWSSTFPPYPGATQPTTFLYHYPKPDKISEAQKTYIASFMDDFESALVAPTFKDPDIGYRKYIDVPSFIDFMFINEIGKNIDAYRLSTFMYKDKDSKGGKLKMGPVWDFNLAIGNVNYCFGGGNTGWALDFNNFCPDDYWVVPFWWKRLWEDEAFLEEAKTRWFALRDAILSDERVMSLVDSLASLLDEAAQRNFQRWPVLSSYVWPNNFVGASYPAEISYLRNWLQDRLRWMDANIAGFNVPQFDPTAYFAPKVYPNPTVGEVKFEYFVEKGTEVRIRIYNSVGQLMQELQNSAENENGVNSAIWQAGSAQAGVYFFTLWYGDERIQSGKIIRQ